MGLEKSEGLNLEFWADTSSGEYLELAKIETTALAAGEEATYTAEITPKEEELYNINAYLYDGRRRIGHETETVLVRK